jgi:Arc/MetJ-type ribon-helix-helix transcriptional regulator
VETATPTISIPRTMKNFIEQKMPGGRYSTPSAYLRALIRDDQDITGNSDVALLTRRGVLVGGGGQESGQTAAAPSRRRK